MEAPQNDPGIEILVRLAKSGEIDPWDVDILVVTDKYLAALDALDERVLAFSGKGLFYACVLLHLKAQVLSREYLPPVVVDELPDVGDYEPLDEDGLDWARVVSTDDGVLLVPRGRLRRRPITLDDLIKALRRCDDFEKKRKESGLPPTSFFVDSTHQDDVARDTIRVRELLDRFIKARTRSVAFERLLGQGVSPGALFVSLLFMAAQEEVDLTQDQFYRNLSISRWRAA